MSKKILIVCLAVLCLAAADPTPVQVKQIEAKREAAIAQARKAYQQAVLAVARSRRKGDVQMHSLTWRF